MDLASVVSTAADFGWSEGSFDLSKNAAETRLEGLRVVAMDFGCKHNILLSC